MNPLLQVFLTLALVTGGTAVAPVFADGRLALTSGERGLGRGPGGER